MTKVTIIAAAAAAILLGGCDGGGSSSRASAESELKAEEARWQQDYASRNADALNSHYAEDGSLASPGVALATTAAARKAALDPIADDPNMKMQFASDRTEVAGSGDLAYTRGRFTMQSTDPASGQVRTDRGNYLTVWKKQADGSWKAAEDFVTPGPPVMPGAP